MTNRGRLRVEGLALGKVSEVGNEAHTTYSAPPNVRLHVTDPNPRAERARRLNESVANTTIDEDLVINGSIHDVVVAEGVFVQVNGSAHARLVISPGAEVRVHGSVHGSVTNRGRLDVYGTMDGTVSNEGEGSSELHEGELLELDGDDN